MKKIVYASGILAALSLTLFTGCKKVNEGAFPAKPQSNGVYQDFSYGTPYFPTLGDADGILISVQAYNEKTELVTSGFYNTSEYGLVKFASATGNFNALADGGNVVLNDSVLVKSSALSYLSSILTYTLNLSNSVSWSVSGNSSNNISALTYTLSGASNPNYSFTINNWGSWTPIYPKTLYPLPTRPLVTHLKPSSTSADSAYYYANYANIIKPYLQDSTQRYTDSVYNATSQYSVPIKGYTTNADTVMIVLYDGAGFYYCRKMVPSIAADSVAYFKPNDFAGYPSYNIGTYTFQVNAIKYNSTLINSRKYYFLQMNSNIKYFGSTR